MRYITPIKLLLFILALSLCAPAMALKKNIAGQIIVVEALDSDGARVTGDAAQITAVISLDGAATNPTDDTNPTEISTTGLYAFTLTAAESNADTVTLDPVSATSGVFLAPVFIYTDAENIKSISGDSTAADNLEAQYDTTGLAGDTFPANQSQINQIANVAGVSHRTANSYVLTSGTQSANTVSETQELDGVRHEHTDDSGSMDLYYEFNIGPGAASGVLMTGYLQGNNDDLEVYGFEWTVSDWRQIGTLEGQASSNDSVHEFKFFDDMVGSGADEGKVRVRFFDGAFTLTNATLAIDQILVEFAQGVEGYQNAAIWYRDNASNTNTVRGIDGTATNPVSTIAAVNTLLASTNLSRVEVANQSSITFTASQENQIFSGKNWTLSLGGQSISGSYFEGANVAGIGTGAAEVHFDHCHMGDVTLPPSDLEGCVLEGTFTVGSEGSYFFENCKSGVAGTATPVFDFGSALNSSDINYRSYSGGLEIENMGAGTGSYTMSLEGFGQLVINANCSGGTVAIRGLFTVSDFASEAVTLSEDARFDSVQLVDDIMDEPLTGDTHNEPTSLGRRIRDIASGISATGDVVSATSNTLTLDAGASDTDGSYDPSVVIVDDGSGNIQIRSILEYFGSAGGNGNPGRTLILDRDWKMVPDNTYTFVIDAENGSISTNEGQVRAGTTTSAQLNSLAPTASSLVGQMIQFRSGTGQDASRLILTYTTSTQTVTFSEVLTAPDATTAYMIYPFGMATLEAIKNDMQSVTDLKALVDSWYNPSTNKGAGVVLVDTTAVNTDMVAEAPTASENATAWFAATPFLNGTFTGLDAMKALVGMARGEWTINASAGTITIKATDDSTDLFTLTLATTARTRTP